MDICRSTRKSGLTSKPAGEVAPILTKPGAHASQTSTHIATQTSPRLAPPNARLPDLQSLAEPPSVRIPAGQIYQLPTPKLTEISDDPLAVLHCMMVLPGHLRTCRVARAGFKLESA